MLVFCRMYFSGGTWHKPQNSHAALLDKYWTKLQMGNMTREELKTVSNCTFTARFPAPVFLCSLKLYSGMWVS